LTYSSLGFQGKEGGRRSVSETSLCRGKVEGGLKKISEPRWEEKDKRDIEQPAPETLLTEKQHKSQTTEGLRKAEISGGGGKMFFKKKNRRVILYGCVYWVIQFAIRRGCSEHREGS